MNELDQQLRALRARYARAGSSAESRESLLRRFDAQRPVSVSRRWAWALPLAAVLIFGMVLMRPAARQPLSVIPAGAENPAYLALSDAQSDTQDDGFIPVPYVPPLATGELVRMVHTELHPSALASLGVNVDPAWTTGIAADLLMGEDGFPRAVRVSTEF
ncbi:MAG: hypothetical protein M3N54_13900 [Acidobacteriota bacterium]|nr:hypothetical protein [Acidobacteriota bacterium]